MEKWRDCWRRGIAPQLSTAGLEALRRALETDDARLIQGETTQPSGHPDCFGDWPVEAACAVGFCAWQGDGLKTVAEVAARFFQVCFATDNALGEPGACRFFLNVFDEWPRAKMRAALLPEVEAALRARAEVPA